MTAPRRRKTDKLGNIQKILYITIAAFGILSGAMATFWNAWAAPRVEKQIECKMDPIEKRMAQVVKGQEFHTALFIQTLTDSQYEKAVKMYHRATQIVPTTK